MKTEIKRVTNGIQSINRLTFIPTEGKKVVIDLWNDELAELKDQLIDYVDFAEAFPESEGY